MRENHAREQYFFAPETSDRLVDLLSRYERPRSLCAPTLGRAMALRKRPSAVLDVDDRFPSAALHHLSAAPLAAFAPFDRISYATVEDVEKNAIELYSNTPLC